MTRRQFRKNVAILSAIRTRWYRNVPTHVKYKDNVRTGMSSKAVPVVAVLISVLIVTAGTCMVDESSADTGTREYKYGNHFGMDLSNVDTFLEELTGKCIY